MHNFAHTLQSKPDPTPAQVAKATRAERRAQHTASQKALWDSAENQNSLPFFIHASSTEPPLKTNHKGQVQLLSRKPKEATKATTTPIVARREEKVVNDPNVMQMPEDEELDSEDEARIEQERVLKQRQDQARADREEKVKKYEETRRRIFGQADGSPDSNGGTPTMNANGRIRGGARGGRGGSRNDSRPTSAGQSPARGAATQKQLFDPDVAPRPGSSSAQRGPVQIAGKSQIIQQPRGPNGSGRGGFDLAQRGGKSEIT